MNGRERTAIQADIDRLRRLSEPGYRTTPADRVFLGRLARDLADRLNEDASTPSTPTEEGT